MDALFLWGVGGSLAVEIVEVCKCYQRKKIELPLRYTLWHFYVFRGLLALMGGSLVIAYGIQSEIVALNIGASAPLIIESLTKGINTE